MMPYKKTKKTKNQKKKRKQNTTAVVRPLDGDTDIFIIVTGVL